MNSMLLPWEIKCNITRAPVRSILIVCVSALMVCGMALYLRNIQITEEALVGLAQQMPVTVRVTNRDRSLHEGLAIRGEAVDYLLESGVRSPVYTATFKAEQVGIIHGTNTLDSMGDISVEDFTFLDGWDENFPDSRKPVIALREDIVRENGWELGDKIDLDFSMVDLERATFPKAGGYSVLLVAVFPNELESAGAIMPVDWLRGIADIASPGMFAYNSFHAVLDEPRELNAYKNAAETWGFHQYNTLADPGIEGDTLSVEDEMYIKTAGEMMETLGLYRTFLIPFFVLMTLIIAMVTFLTLRSCQSQIAIASSLGRQKFCNAAAYFCSTVIVQLTGCLLALLILTLTLDLLPSLGRITLGVFSLCALGGTAVALLLLFRFDTLTLLTKTD